MSKEKSNEMDKQDTGFKDGDSLTICCSEEMANKLESCKTVNDIKNWLKEAFVDADNDADASQVN